MPRPPKYQNTDERNAARKSQKTKYAQSERGRVARSVQNHIAYKRQNGRRGSATTPSILPVIPRMARMPVHGSLLFRAAFQQPHLYAPTPLTYDRLLSLHSTPTFSLGDIDLLHGLYQRLELDSHDARIKQFKEGNKIRLQHKINNELRVAVKTWKCIWKKCIEDIEYDADMDEVHLQWISRSIEHLREEVYLLSTANRAQSYITSVEARIPEISM